MSLAIISTTLDALKLSWHRRKALIFALLPVAIVLAGIDTGESALYGQKKTMSSAGIQIALLLVELPFWAIFAITIHRLVLLDEVPRPSAWPYGWSVRETRLLGWFALGLLVGTIALMALALLLNALFALIVGIDALNGPMKMAPFFVVMLTLIYMGTRLSLLSPATSLGQRVGISWALRMSQGNSFRLFLVVAVLAVPAYLLSYGFDSDQENTFGIRFIFNLLLQLLSIPPIIGLSISFRKLVSQDTATLG
jgi:hypothetical protein